MAKKRVHELAKELGIETKELLSFLPGDLKSVSSVDDELCELARKKYSKTAAADGNASEAKPAEKPSTAEAGKTAGEKNPDEKKGEEKAPEKKKKKPTFVFRPENAKTSFGNVIAGKAAKEGVETKKPVPRDENRGPIKAHVPTTAEQYKENIKNAEPKEPDKKPEENANAKTEKTVSEPAETVNEKTEKANAEKADPSLQKKPEDLSQAESAPAAKDMSEKRPENEKPENTQEKPEEKTPEKKPVKETGASKEEPKEEKKPAANAQKGEKKPDGKPQEKGGFKITSADKYSNGEGKPFKKIGSGLTFSGNKDGKKLHIVDNRNKDDYRNGDRRNQFQGQGKPGAGKPGVGKTGQGFQKRDNNGKPMDNRGPKKDFGNNNRPQGGMMPGSTETFGKDNRPKRTGGKDSRDRNAYNRDKTKNAENFKNLTRDQNKKQEVKKEEEVIKMIVLPEVITIKELADKMKMKSADLIRKLFLQGKMLTLNSELSYEEAENIAIEYEILCEKEVEEDVIGELLKEDPEDESTMVKRPPVVCVMGHVDHGKTSLLDAIRKTNVTSREAGGITQAIGAYTVNCNGEQITFLDTPGHEAFTAMRMRGAQATDVAILVVAADDGVMPQTVEAINHAKAAGVEIIVAVNKIDKPTADINRVMKELSEYGILSEEWGGQNVFVPVSAKTGENIDKLLEMILLVTEVKELKANPNREMRGIVIEAKLDKGRGPVTTILVQKGTLKAGDFISAGSFYGRVRAMINSNGETIKSAGPSMPIEVLGLNGVPNAGEVCIGHKNEKDAKSYANTFIAEEKKKKVAESKKKLTLDSLFADIQAGNIKELPIIVKADVQGSVEAVKTSIEKLSNEEVMVKVIHGGVGLINESDVSLASASNAIIIGFNVKPDPQAKNLADEESVDVRLYKVIYQAIDDVEAAMKGMLAPVYEEKILGHAEVRAIFKASKVGIIAGSYVLDGTIERGTKIRLTRDGEELFDGDLASLKHEKDDVKTVREGFECGIVLEKFTDIQEGDRMECYKMVQVEQK